MIIPDSSAWVEYLRGTGSDVHRRLARAIRANEPITVTQPVAMEVLAGARLEDFTELRSLLDSFPLASVDLALDFDEAAVLYATCRRGGETVRSMVDCLLAAVVIRNGATVLHRDRDFDVLARYSPLMVEPV